MRQRIQLTDTNRPIAWSEMTYLRSMKDILFGFEGTTSNRPESGDYSGEVTPVPIPNTVVKLLSADDTWGATPWEIRTSQVQQKAPRHNLGVFLHNI